MKTPEEKDLLNDVIRDDSYAGFRAELFDQIRAKLRRQRTIKTARRLLALAACLMIALAFLHFQKRTPRPTRGTSRIDLVRTIPLRPDQIVTTSGKGEANSPAETVFVSTARSKVEVIYTVAGSIERISDEQLLDLFKGQSVVLVHTGPNERRLVFPENNEGR